LKFVLFWNGTDQVGNRVLGQLRGCRRSASLGVRRQAGLKAQCHYKRDDASRARTWFETSDEETSRPRSQTGMMDGVIDVRQVAEPAIYRTCATLSGHEQYSPPPDG
jgi:hypothetical protein